MATLEHYWKKRNFQKTAEPKGKTPTKAKGMSYTIQKHDASALHYDFRLELDGVLKSWAVPKGPSLDPQKKRLAVHVEDHPVEYGTFEGTIPAGEYGGGTVLLWDRGTWEPIGDPHEEYAKGKLKFKLHGVKLKGIWNLIRIKAREGGGKRQDKTWLLIKERDEEAKPETSYSITEEQPQSVRKEISHLKTKKVKDQPALKSQNEKSSPIRRLARRFSKKAKIPRVEEFPDVRRSPLPTEFQPQLATLVKAPPVGDQWLNEIKFDGYRLNTRVEKGDVSLITRNGKDWTHRFPFIVSELTKLSLNNALLDGEIVAFDAKGHPSFQALQNHLDEQKARHTDATPLGYFLFDIIHYEGYDLHAVPLLMRKELLRAILSSKEGAIRFTEHVIGNGGKTFERLCKNGGEGMIAKRADSRYQERRSTDWVKVKCSHSQEFLIGGYVPSAAFKGDLGALLLGYRDEAGQLRYCGKVGTGFNTSTRHRLTETLNSIATAEAAFVNPPSGFGFKNVKWAEPQLIAQIAFTEWTNDGNLRHPSFLGLREDKLPVEVHRDEPTETKTASAKRVKTHSTPTTITHPDRMLYPDVGITKADLGAYFKSIAPRLLPFVKQRPLSIVRCPQGSNAKCFFQRHHTEGLPASLRGIDVSEAHDGSLQSIILDNAAGLIALAQIGSLEIHPWGAPVDDIEHPDHITFDLDPGAAVTWKDLVAAANITRRILEKLKLKSFVKTSGGKGLHVVVPLNRKNSWEEIATFAKALAEAMARFDSRKFVAVVSKSQRQGKIYIDYLRNVRGATSVAPYSPRARAGATVSMPISWKELEKAKDTLSFDITSAPKRLKSPDPWKDYFKAKQSVNAKMTSALNALASPPIRGPQNLRSKFVGDLSLGP